MLRHTLEFTQETRVFNEIDIVHVMRYKHNLCKDG